MGGSLQSKGGDRKLLHAFTETGQQTKRAVDSQCTLDDGKKQKDRKHWQKATLRASWGVRGWGKRCFREWYKVDLEDEKGSMARKEGQIEGHLA